MQTNERAHRTTGWSTMLMAAVVALALGVALSLPACASDTTSQSQTDAAGSATQEQTSDTSSDATDSGDDSVDATDGTSSQQDTSDSSATTDSDSASSDEAPTAAAGAVMPDGWYMGTLTNSTPSDSAFTSATVVGDRWVLTGTVDYAQSEDALWDTTTQQGPETWSVPVADDAQLASSGGDASDQSVSRADFESVMEQLNGLGLILHVQDGSVVYACLAS